TSLPSVVTTPSATRPSSTNSASRSLPSRRQWITTFTIPNTASASRPRSPARATPSSASGPRWPRMSGSAFSASSAAMPALLRSTRRTPPRSAASSPNTRSTSTSHSAAHRGEARKSEQLRAGCAQRGRRVGRLPNTRIRRTRCIRPPEESECRGIARRRNQAAHRRRDDHVRPHLHLRSGDPDFVDKLVGLTFGNMAYDAMLEGKTGLMSALVKGCYELVPIPDPKLGPRKLDVATMYNTERYRPMYANKRGLPVFLQRVVVGQSVIRGFPGD